MIRLILLLALPAYAQPVSEHPVSALEEQRYCGAPARTAAGEIRRSSAVLGAFKRAHPWVVSQFDL